MDSLRLSLLLIGAVIVIALILWSRFSSRVQRSKLDLPVFKMPPGAMDRLPDIEQRTAPSLGDDLPSMDNLQDTDEPEAEATAATVPEQEIITFYLMAPAGKTLAGGRILSALTAAGLEYGEMDIFHERDGLNDTPRFSVANMVEPGTFPISDMARFGTPGLVMFMQLPLPGDALVAFDDMLGKARSIAAHLNAQLCSQRREPLDQEQIDQLRHRIETRYC